MKKTIILILAITIMMLVGCVKESAITTTTTKNKADPLKGYTESNSLVKFENNDLDKVNMEATFDNKSVTTIVDDTELCAYQIFGDGMCLQRDCVNRIWGYTTGKNICVELNGRSYYGTVENEEFSVYLPMMNAGGPYKLSIVSEVGRITFKNVYIGEVYLASGQSNMEWKTNWSGTVMADLYSNSEACLNESIRFLDLKNTGNTKSPTTKVQSGMDWSYACSQTIQNFSANAYLFALHMQEELGVPVGIISTAVGGSILEYWLSAEAYKELKNEATCVVNTEEKLFTPSIGYNGLIYPCLGYNFRGVIWYQGCSNTIGSQGSYDVALKKLISSWRKDFNNPNMTFTVFELARYNQSPVAFSTINERITKVASEDELVCYVNNMDQGDWYNIHPQDKRVIAQRASDITLRTFFGFDKAMSPEIERYEVVDSKTVKIYVTRDVVALNGNNGFEVRGTMGYSYDCEVTVEGNVITITSSNDFNGVRYGYQAKMDDENKADVSKICSIFANGDDKLPLNLFKIDF